VYHLEKKGEDKRLRDKQQNVEAYVPNLNKEEQKGGVNSGSWHDEPGRCNPALVGKEPEQFATRGKHYLDEQRIGTWSGRAAPKHRGKGPTNPQGKGRMNAE